MSELAYERVQAALARLKLSEIAGLLDSIAEQAARERHRGDVGLAEHAVAEQAEVEHRLGHAQLDLHEQHERHDADRAGEQDLG